MMRKGQKVIATITCIVSYGAFCEVMDDGMLRKGLIHISEFSDYYVTSVNQFVSTGDKIEVEIIDIIEDANQLKLSYKKLHPELLKSEELKAKEAKKLKE